MKISRIMSRIFNPRKKGKVIVITGCPGIGKSTISQSLCKKLKRSLYISVDDLRENVISGYEFPAKMDWNEETFLQSRLARKSALYIAKLYSDHGFDVVVDDTVYGKNIDKWLRSFAKGQLFVFHLHSNLETVLKRNRMRKFGKLSDQIIRLLHKEFEVFNKRYRLERRIALIDNREGKAVAINRIIGALT